MEILKVEDIKKYYGKKENLVKALEGVSFCMEKGSFVAVTGQSGSGKSTLLNLIGGLDVPTDGKIFVQGQDIAKLKRKEQTVFRRRNIGFIFQNYSLMPELSVYDNVVLPITMDFRKKVDHGYIKEILETLGIWDKRKKTPNELSGGQQQRVAIARALANRPALILADEPTGNLDSRTTIDVMGLLKKSNREFGQTIIMVTHNEELAQSCDAILHIKDGMLKKGAD
ncbi:MAG: ABC transporter ATP-binding protein [Lachnospiraceae bacterium]|nr:ABC transporter ATP-binding protein [Lachnospiraceae bacterium]